MTIQQLIAKRLKLYVRRKVITTLDGNYESVFRGKGIELDYLREYVVGDDIKDIDWPASARTSMVHTRVYATLRDQRILVIADTSPSMLVSSQHGMKKLEALYGLIVTLGMFVRKNRDLLAICAAQPDGSVAISRFGNTNHHIESLLRRLDFTLHHTPPQQAKTLIELLQHTVHSLKRRTAIFVVSDSTTDPATLKPWLRKLSVRHQLFFLQLEPSSPFGIAEDEDASLLDIETARAFWAELRQDAKLQQEWYQAMQQFQSGLQQACKTNGVAYGFVDRAEHTPEALRTLFLLSKRYAKRH